MDSGLRGQDLKILDFAASNAERGHYPNGGVSCKLDHDWIVARYQGYKENNDKLISTTLRAQAICTRSRVRY